jgi:hypothetical protein
MIPPCCPAPQARPVAPQDFPSSLPPTAPPADFLGSKEDGEGQNFGRAMWVKQCHKPPIWEYGLYTTYKNCDLGDGLLAFDPRYVLLSFRKWYLQDSKCCF